MTIGVIGVALTLLARPAEANPWRTSGFWATLLAYVGCIIAQWSYVGWSIAHDNDAAQAGIWFMLLMEGAFVLAGLYTLIAYAVTWVLTRYHARLSWSKKLPPAPGVQLGAAALVLFLATFGLLFAFPPSPHAMPRSIVVDMGFALAALAVALGAALQARGGRRASLGRILVWCGAAALLAGGLLDSFTATSLSGLDGYYPWTNTHSSGPGTVVLPAGMMALAAGIGGMSTRRMEGHST